MPTRSWISYLDMISDRVWMLQLLERDCGGGGGDLMSSMYAESFDEFSDLRWTGPAHQQFFFYFFIKNGHVARVNGDINYRKNEGLKFHHTSIYGNSC